MSKSASIPNIDMGKAYDVRFEGSDIHIDFLDNLANFFGRNMPAHRHDRFYQIHWIDQGCADVMLHEKHYQGTAPLFYFTPPAIPHSFKLDENATGLVLTIRREFVHRLLTGADQALFTQSFSAPCFIELNSVTEKLSREAKNFPLLIKLLADEFFGNALGRNQSLSALINLVLMSVIRLSKIPRHSESLTEDTVKIFTAFNDLIDKHHHQQWSLTDYCRSLNLSQSRLYDICQRLANTAPKSIVFQRQIEEARWQLIYTSTAINTIALNLGFKDPAYFCRFFTKHTGLSPKAFRFKFLNPMGQSIEL